MAAGDEANVKVRDALMDIKVLEHVDKNGLEQWRPVFKAPFPLDAAGIAPGLPGAGTAAARLDDRSGARRSPRRAGRGGRRGSGDPGRQDAALAITSAVASRRMTEVTADGTRVRTVAIEDEDPERVVAAVRLMELDRFPNTSYPRGLRRVLGRPGGGTR